jgi:hypothetical protein
MRAYSLASLIFLLLLLPQLGQAQRRNALAPEAKVDSVFRQHFASIAKSGTGNPLSHEDAYFIQLLGHLSGMKNYFWCYTSMGLTKDGLPKYEKWYAAYRSQITWNTIRQGFALMSIPLPSIVSDSFSIALDRKEKILDNLLIK